MSAPAGLPWLLSLEAWRRIAALTGAVAVLAVVYAFVAPKWYRSQVTIVPAKPARGGASGIAAMLGGDLAGLASGLDVTGAGADVQRIAAVLRSDTVSDAVIARFGLRDRYRERYQETTRDALWRHCAVRPLPKPGLVELSCEDREPKFVQEMLAYFAEYGNEVFRRVSVGSATEEVRFLEKRAAELRSQSVDTARAMREFQEKHRIVDIDTQTKAVVSAIAGLQSQRLNRQLELDFARRFSSADESTLRQLRSQLAVVDEQLELLQAERPEGAASVAGQPPQGLMPPALAVPKLREQFEALYRDRKVAEATLVFALERLESAKANEARDVSTFMVLDPPSLPDRHSRPKRAVVVLAGTLLGLIGALAVEWWRQGGGPGQWVAALLRKGQPPAQG